jgi:hypothetical protein
MAVDASVADRFWGATEFSEMISMIALSVGDNCSRKWRKTIPLGGTGCISSPF